MSGKAGKEDEAGKATTPAAPPRRVTRVSLNGSQQAARLQQNEDVMSEELQRKHFLHEGKSEESEAAAEVSKDRTRSKDTTMLVQESWELVEKDLETHGIKFFMRIFEIAPAALQLFSFKDDPDLPNSPQLRKHAGEVMRTVGQAVAGLEDVAALVPVLQALGERHSGYGVVPNHFPIVGEALLWTLEQGLGDKWTPEVKTAWTHTWGNVVKVMLPAVLKAKAAGIHGVVSPVAVARQGSRQVKEVEGRGSSATPASGRGGGGGSGESEESEAAAEVSKDRTRSKDTTMLVQESWELVEKDLETHGIKFFMRIFEIAPAALQLFSFKDDPDLPNSPQLRKHAGEVMRTVGQAVAGLEDVAALVPVLQALGERHSGYGVVPNHFPIVGEALLWTLEQGLGDKWTPEVKTEWTEAWDLLVSLMSPALVSAAHRDNPSMRSVQASTANPRDTNRYQEIPRDTPQDVLSIVKQPNGVEKPSGGASNDGAPNGGAPGMREPNIQVWSRAGSFADVGKTTSSSPYVSGGPQRDTHAFNRSVTSDGSLKCPFAGGCVCVRGVWRMGGWVRVSE
jgi:hemoglobin-like flavoprotein